jgi:effector-binding domain-containing protein
VSAQQPQVDEREPQPYVAIPLRVEMAGGFGDAIESGFAELSAWLKEQGVEPAGPPFIRYLLIAMDGELEIELAVPVAPDVTSDGRVRADILPGGRYATLLHVGPYDELVASNAALQDWAEEQGVVWDSWETAEGSAWRGRVEHYLTDPTSEPDPAKWKVEVAYLVAED